MDLLKVSRYTCNPAGSPQGLWLSFQGHGRPAKKDQIFIFLNLQIDQNINFAKLPSVKWQFFVCGELYKFQHIWASRRPREICLTNLKSKG